MKRKMAIAYKQKLIISGNFVERYQYANKIFSGYERGRVRGSGDPTPRKDFSVSRAMNNLRRLIESNPQLFRLVTLTFTRNVADVSIANSHFTKFIQRVKYNLYKDFQYISVLEFQDRGAVHYHSVVSHFIKQKTLKKVWGKGQQVWINKVYNPEGIGAYLSMYLQQDGFDDRFYGKKKYFCSKNINRPVVIKNDFLVDNFMNRNKNFLRLKFACAFNSEYVGKVHYYHYYGNRNLFAIKKQSR
jgi:hypothetical protein